MALLAVIVFGAPLVLLIVFISKVGGLTARVQWLEQELVRLRAIVSFLSPPQRPVAPPVPPPETGKPPAAVVVPQDSFQGAPQPAEPAHATTAESRSQAREEWEVFVGGKLLNRIGAIALIVGVGFFLKYAFDNNWITEVMRVAIGGIAGILLLLLGEHFDRKAFHIFSQGLIGAGIAILYLSVYASFNFYHLVSQLAAFGLMSFVTLIAFSQALRYDSLAISLIGWAGGYLTPFLLSTGVTNEAGLFTYIDLLEAGLLAIVLVKKRWMVLELLTLAGTYCVFALWHSSSYSEDAFLLTVLFLTLFWLLFFLVDIFRIEGDAEPHPLRRWVNILNAALFYMYLYVLVDAQHHQIMGMLTAVLAYLYAVPAFLIRRRSPGSPALRDHIMTTVVLVVIATSIQYAGFITVTIWACEAFALMWLAQRWGYHYLAGAALLFFLVIVGKLLQTAAAFSFEPAGAFTLVLNTRFLAFAAVAASMGLCAYLIARMDMKMKSTLTLLLHAGWCLLVFMLLTSETVDFFSARATEVSGDQVVSLRFLRDMTILCVWMLYAIPLVRFGLRSNLSPVLIAGLVLAGLTFLMTVLWGGAFQPASEFRLLFNARMLAVTLVLAGSLVIARFLKYAHKLREVVQPVYPVLLFSQVVLLLLMLSAETRDLFERQIWFLLRQIPPAHEELGTVENVKQMSLSLLWVIYGIVLMTAGIWRRVRGMRVLAIIILGTAILKIFIYDLSFLQTLYRIFSFIGLGLVLLAASYMYHRYRGMLYAQNETGGAGESGLKKGM